MFLYHKNRLTWNKRIWVVAVDMGYGHQRAAYPLRHLAENGEILAVGSPQITSIAERKDWERMLRMYEGFSQATSIPIIGKGIFGMLDKLLHIPSYYPIRNLSVPTMQTRLLKSKIKNGLCAGLLEHISANHQPIITTYFAPAIAADSAGYDAVYCVICDADINRVWVAEEASESNIKYFAPCGKAAQRLRSYGVPDNNIFITGFPLPEELLGGTELKVLKKNLAQRLANLDPKGRFRIRNEKNIEHFLGGHLIDSVPKEYVTITFAVGGAGAQKEIAASLLHSLRSSLLHGRIKLNIVVGVKQHLVDYFEQHIDEELRSSNSVKIVHASNLFSYFDAFNEVLQTTDILWTKPSELVFYSALGIPVILSPAIGSQEQFNKYWLIELTAGIKQFSLAYADHWLNDFLNSGRLAEAAWAGFIKGRKLGTYKIREVLNTGSMTKSDSPLLR
ncbi:MAG: hypothetical protein HYV28_07145 [Ignavibacteriales bacterium]|nr:hypothetical protein [Ignavibacteriales bacterium]